MARLGDICRFQSGGTPSKNNPLYFGGTIPWITTVALNGSVIGVENAVEWITEKAIIESAAKIVPANSIMVGTRVGVGKVAINSVPMSTSQDIVSLLEIDESKWNKAFMCKWLSSKSDYLQSQARGATIKGIKIETIAALEVPEISIKEQLSVSVCLDKVSQLISLRKQQLAKLDELVKARFVEMFLAFSNRTNLPKVNRKQVEGFCCPIPDWQTQEQFSSFVAQVNKQKLTIQQSLDKLEVLKKSLMQEYFG